MITQLPRLPEFYKVIPCNREEKTLFWDQVLPQNFATIDLAEDAAGMVREATGIDYVIMKVEQTFVGANFFFDLVNVTQETVN